VSVGAQLTAARIDQEFGAVIGCLLSWFRWGLRVITWYVGTALDVGVGGSDERDESIGRLNKSWISKSLNQWFVE
jgi:hypothetical protein